MDYMIMRTNTNNRKSNNVIDMPLIQSEQQNSTSEIVVNSTGDKVEEII